MSHLDLACRMQLDLLPVDSLLQHQVVILQLRHALLQLLVAILHVSHSVTQPQDLISLVSLHQIKRSLHTRCHQAC